MYVLYVKWADLTEQFYVHRPAADTWDVQPASRVAEES